MGDRAVELRPAPVHPDRMCFLRKRRASTVPTFPEASNGECQMLADGRAVVPETHPYPLADRKAMVPGADGDLIQQLGRFLRDGGRPVPSVPVRIRATDFRDNYNGYAILGRDADTVIVEDVLITRTFKVFGHNGEYFAVLVSRAVPQRSRPGAPGRVRIRPTRTERGRRHAGVTRCQTPRSRTRPVRARGAGGGRDRGA